MRYGERDAFLESWEWRTVRMRALERDGAKCACCGRTTADGVTMNVDHIRPRKRHPELALTLENLQVLCNECNHGKGNSFETDWRQKHQWWPETPWQSAAIQALIHWPQIGRRLRPAVVLDEGKLTDSEAVLELVLLRCQLYPNSKPEEFAEMWNGTDFSHFINAKIAEPVDESFAEKVLAELACPTE